MTETTILATPPAPTNSPSARRDYTLGEEIASSVIHGVGIGLAVAALVLLFVVR